jgi:hypothetical protein
VLDHPESATIRFRVANPDFYFIALLLKTEGEAYAIARV